MKKSTDELVEEFLANGGKIEKLDYIEPEDKKTIGSISKKAPEIMSLAEGELMYGEKQKRKKKVKEPDYSDIDMSLIPEHLHEFIKKPASDKQDVDDKGGATSETN